MGLLIGHSEPEWHNANELPPNEKQVFAEFEIPNCRDIFCSAIVIDGEWKWSPLSLVHEMHRDPRTRDSDAIVLERWFAEKEGLE